jgi:hypothetical protein
MIDPRIPLADLKSQAANPFLNDEKLREEPKGTGGSAVQL